MPSVKDTIRPGPSSEISPIQTIGRSASSLEAMTGPAVPAQINAAVPSTGGSAASPGNSVDLS